MTTPAVPDAVDTVVIGAGQSGLAVGYHLAQRGVEFVILDANDEIGASWRNRWDSLRLFTPSHYSSLPGMPFPAPDRLVTPIMWFLANRVIDVRNPLGRRVRDHFLDPPRGIPRGRVTRRALGAAGIDWVARTTGVDDGRPSLDDGTVLDVRTVVWCTGFHADFGWIQLPVFGDDGYPIHARGVVEAQPGLYFMGLPFQTTLSSALIGGVGRDAAHIALHVHERQQRPAVSVAG